eukprot:scpid49266/ scgid9304/ 
MTSKMRHICALLLVMPCLAWAQPFPTLPTSFVAEVEVNNLNLGRTSHVSQLFDGFAQKSRLEVLRNGTSQSVIDHIQSDIRYISDRTLRTCQAQKYTQRNRLTNGFGRDPHLLTVNDFYEFGSMYHRSYGGVATVRGIICDRYIGSYTNWTNGVYTSYSMQWYFARQSNWTMPAGDVGSTAIPVRLDLVGATNSSRGPPVTPTPQQQPLYRFHHVYDFMKFLPDDAAQSELFGAGYNPPGGILCTGVPQIYDLPTLPDQFYYSSFSSSAYEVSYVSNYAYDSVRGETAVTYDIEFSNNGTNLTGTTYGGLHHVIHNFRQGTQYNITPQACSTETLTSIVGTPQARDVSQYHGHAKLQSGNQVFQFSPEANFTYQGSRSILGYQLDLWSTIRNDVQLDSSLPKNQKSLWQYFFSPLLYKVNTLNGLLTHTRVPIEIHIFSLEPDSKVPPIFQLTGSYYVGPAPARLFDTSSCFTASQQSTAMFALNTPYSNSRAIRMAVMKALSSTLGLETDRFQATIFPGEGNLLNVLVTAEDLPTVGDPSLLSSLPTLSAAMKKLSDAIKGGTFSVSLPATGSVLAKSSSFTASTESEPTTYSAAELAGLAVGVLVLGFICGVLLVHVVLRVKGKK